MPEHPTCANCRFFANTSSWSSQCRRRAPLMSLELSVQGSSQMQSLRSREGVDWPEQKATVSWPTVKATDWCGEFEHKEQANENAGEIP